MQFSSFSSQSESIIGVPYLNCFLGQHVLVSRHHLEPPAEVSEASAEMHFILKLFEDLIVMEVGMCEETVKPTDDVVEVLFGVGRNRNPVEVVRVHDCSGVIQGMDHVVNGAAVRGAFMRCTDENELLVSRHLGASLARADSK